MSEKLGRINEYVSLIPYNSVTIIGSSLKYEMKISYTSLQAFQIHYFTLHATNICIEIKQCTELEHKVK